MSQVKDFLLAEARKPIVAFGKTARWLLKEVALYALRLILWGLFFVLPSFFFVFLGFHWVTSKVRQEIGKATSQPGWVSQAPIQTETPLARLSALRTLSRDLKFWVREFERLKK